MEKNSQKHRKRNLEKNRKTSKDKNTNIKEKNIYDLYI